MKQYGPFSIVRVPRVVSGTTDTPSGSNAGEMIETTSASAVTITLDSSGWLANEGSDLMQLGAGAVSFVAAGGSQIFPTGATLRTQGSVASFVYVGTVGGTPTFVLFGDFVKGVNRVCSAVSGNTSAAAAVGFDYAYFVSAGAVLTLPTAVGNVSAYTVKNSGVVNCSVASTSSQTFDGAAGPVTLAPGDAVTFYSDNANWWIT